ncbi:MAG TPA: hypothetical protein VFV50_09695 [Bdellovibrionales bacterium]|nr:hypothetical protein [Bdellovibrionales bacterium]
MKQAIAIVLLLTFSAGARAAGSNYSYISWQPEAGQFAVSPGLSFSYAKADLSGFLLGFQVTGESTSTSTGVSVPLEYGITEMIGVGLSVGYGASTSETKTTVMGSAPTESSSSNRGFSNLGLDVKLRHLFGNFGLYYGVSASVSPGEATYDSSAKEGNNFSGGFSASPFLAFHVAANSGVFIGARLAYTSRGERKTAYSNPTRDAATTGGNSFSAGIFVEFPELSWHPLFEITHTKTERSETITRTGFSETRSEYDGGPGIILFGARSYIEVTPGFELIPGLAYMMPTQNTSQGLNIDSYNSFLLSAGARATF